MPLAQGPIEGLTQASIVVRIQALIRGSGRIVVRIPDLIRARILGRTWGQIPDLTVLPAVAADPI